MAGMERRVFQKESACKREEKADIEEEAKDNRRNLEISFPL